MCRGSWHCFFLTPLTFLLAVLLGKSEKGVGKSTIFSGYHRENLSGDQEYCKYFLPLLNQTSVSLESWHSCLGAESYYSGRLGVAQGMVIRVYKDKGDKGDLDATVGHSRAIIHICGCPGKARQAESESSPQCDNQGWFECVITPMVQNSKSLNALWYPGLGLEEGKSRKMGKIQVICS